MSTANFRTLVGVMRINDYEQVIGKFRTYCEAHREKAYSKCKYSKFLRILIKDSELRYDLLKLNSFESIAKYVDLDLSKSCYENLEMSLLFTFLTNLKYVNPWVKRTTLCSKLRFEFASSLKYMFMSNRRDFLAFVPLVTCNRPASEYEDKETILSLIDRYVYYTAMSTITFLGIQQVPLSSENAVRVVEAHKLKSETLQIPFKFNANNDYTEYTDEYTSQGIPVQKAQAMEQPYEVVQPASLKYVWAVSSHWCVRTKETITTEFSPLKGTSSCYELALKDLSKVKVDYLFQGYWKRSHKPNPKIAWSIGLGNLDSQFLFVIVHDSNAVRLCTFSLASLEAMHKHILKGCKNPEQLQYEIYCPSRLMAQNSILVVTYKGKNIGFLKEERLFNCRNI